MLIIFFSNLKNIEILRIILLQSIKNDDGINSNLLLSFLSSLIELELIISLSLYPKTLYSIMLIIFLFHNISKNIKNKKNKK